MSRTAYKCTPAMIGRIRKAAEAGRSRVEVIEAEGISMASLKKLISRHAIKFEKLAKMRVLRLAAVRAAEETRQIPLHRVADVKRAQGVLAREIAAARAEIAAGTSPPFKSADWV